MLRISKNLPKRFPRPTPMRRHSTAPDAPAGYTADPTAPPMLRYQSSLPRLPVPTLASTCAKYLETVQPLLPAAEYAKTESLVRQFEKSDTAKELQKRLEGRAAQGEVKNWLSEWWNEAAYMGYRDPVVVYVSYFFVHKDDKALRNPAKRAGALVKAMLAFRKMVESGTLEPEKVRGTPLCMSSYKWLFHANRYPVIPTDTAHKFDPQTHNHLVVLRRNRFYTVPLAHNGAELSAADLELQFQRIYDDAAKQEPGVPIGALTGDNRDLWARAREALVAKGSNRELLEKVESAAAVLVLDEHKPITREDISWQCWVGNGRNRWYDKHQLIVFDNARSGFLGEHSCMDGTPTLRMNEFILASLKLNKLDLGSPSPTPSLPPPEELKFTIDESITSLITSAEGRFDSLVGKHELLVLHYEGYGKSLMKKHRFSPDAWVQMVKQLAFHKMHGRPGVTYESAQTRKYQLGRTEVIRSASNESKAFVEAISAPHPDPVHVKALFAKAVKRHMEYSAWAADGQGVDRHLFGLKKCLKEGEEVPEIYKDKAFTKSSHWELSTSQLSSPYFDGWGYGEVVPDGYGLSYAIGDEYVRWTITSLKRDTAVLKHYLAEAATEVREMLEAAKKVEERAEKEKGKL